MSYPLAGCLHWQDDDGPTIECNGLGSPVHVQSDGTKFYTSIQLDQLEFHVGDVVRLNPSEGVRDRDTQQVFYVAQLLAFYEDPDEMMYAEVRWFSLPHEVTQVRKKKYQLIDNEIFDTDEVEDVPAGSILEIVSVKAPNNPRNAARRPSTGSGAIAGNSTATIGGQLSHFVCRKISKDDGDVLHMWSEHTMFERGLELSRYGFAYDRQELLEIAAQRAGHAVGGAAAARAAATDDPFAAAIAQLHISIIPDTLPCRSAEVAQIEEFIHRSIDTCGSPSPLYISGMPGTGKTASVTSAILRLRQKVREGTCKPFKFLEINCLRLRTQTDAYTNLWREISGNHVAPLKALNCLSKHFATDKAASGHLMVVSGPPSSSSTSSSGPTPLVLLLDEMDFMINRGLNNVLYNFLNWPLQHRSGLVIIGIANTFDLPDKLNTVFGSRYRCEFHRIAFGSYNFEQFKEILQDRLKGLQVPLVNDNVIMFIARKAGSVTGDLRTALQICQGTLEKMRQANAGLSSTALAAIPEREYFVRAASIVAEVVKTFKENPPVAMLRASCLLDKAILLAMCRHIKSTGGNLEMTVDMIYDRLRDLLAWATVNRPEAYFPLPPVELFDLAIERMLDHELLKSVLEGKTVQRRGLGGNRCVEVEGGVVGGVYIRPRSALLMPRQEMGDILGILANEPFAAFAT